MKNTSSTIAVPPVVFPNGNSIVGPKVLAYAERYQNLLNQTAQSILALAETCYEAKSHLSENEFEEFKTEVGLKSQSTLSKLLGIGEKSTRLRPHVDKLPQAWTTLYKLSRLEPNEFDRIIPILSVDLTASDINAELNISTSKSAKASPDICITFDNKPTSVRRKVYDELREITDRYGCNLVMSKSFSNEINVTKINEAA
jgi:hypothetical protein